MVEWNVHSCLWIFKSIIPWVYLICFTIGCIDGLYGRNCSIPCPSQHSAGSVFHGATAAMRTVTTCMGVENQVRMRLVTFHFYFSLQMVIFCFKLPLVFIIAECKCGKYGDYCDLSSRYPNYGNRWQLVCHCNQVFCDPYRGCSGLLYNNFKYKTEFYKIYFLKSN